MRFSLMDKSENGNINYITFVVEKNLVIVEESVKTQEEKLIKTFELRVTENYKYLEAMVIQSENLKMWVEQIVSRAKKENRLINLTNQGGG